MLEFDIIKKNFKPLTNSKIARNLADDVAKFSLKKGEELIISKDIFVEDVHFLRQDGGFAIAQKMLAANLSDIASAGGRPLYYMLGFSKNNDEKFLKEFTRGLKFTQKEFSISLIGGDTIASEKLFFSITIFATVKKNKILSRDAAEAGNLIFVSGNIGDAFLGLKLKMENLDNLSQKDKKYLLNRHLFPTPRIELGQNLLAKNLSKCAIDVSDGLLADLKHICEESNLSAKISLDKIPLSDVAKNFLKKKSKLTILDLISGGDDYELIFTANKKNQQKILSLAKALNLKITCIGELTKKSESKIILFDQDNKKINIKKFGYEH